MIARFSDVNALLVGPMTTGYYNWTDTYPRDFAFDEAVKHMIIR